MEWRSLIKDWKIRLEKDLLGTAMILANDIQDSMEQRGEGGGMDTANLNKLMEFINSREFTTITQPMHFDDGYIAGGRWTIGKAPGIASVFEKIIIQINKDEELRDKRDRLVEAFLDANGRVSSGSVLYCLPLYPAGANDDTRETFDLALPIALDGRSDQRTQARRALIDYADSKRAIIQDSLEI